MLHIKEASELLAESVPSIERIEAQAEALKNQQSTQLQHLVDSFKSFIVALARNPNVRAHMIQIIQLLEESLSDIISAAAKLEEKMEKTETAPSMKDVAEKVDEVKEKVEKKLSLSKSQSREKLRGLLFELGTTSEYKEFINSLSTFFQTNWNYLSTFFEESTVQNKTYTALLVVVGDVQTILERFSGDKSLNDLRTRLGGLLNTISHDQKVKQLFSRWRDFIKKTFESPETTQNLDIQSLDKELLSLLDTGRDLFKKEKLQEDIGFIFKEMKELFERIKEDTALNTFGKDFQHIKKGLLSSEEGKLDFTTLKNSLPTLKNVLVPTLTTALRHIPVPTITVDNEKYYLQLSNLSVAAQDLIPEKIRIHFSNDIFFDFSSDRNDHLVSRLTVLMRDFNATVRDMNFKYDRKKMPQISDMGIADIEILGIDIDLRWRMEMDESRLCFYVDNVKCLIDSIKTDIKEANHKMLDNIYLTLFSGSLKTSLEETIEDTLREKLLEFSIDTSTPLSEQIPLLQA